MTFAGVQSIHDVVYCNPVPMALAIQTAPRSQPTLDKTIASLDAAGLDRWEGPKFIIADGYDPEPRNGWIVEGVPQRLGSARTLARLLQRTGDTMPVLYLQDDVVLSRRALDYIRRVDLGAFGFVSWFADKKYVLSSFPLLAVPVSDWITTQALTVSPAAIKRFLASKELIAGWREHGCDKLLCASLAGQPFAVHQPSLVQHTGVGISAIRDDWSAGASPTFIGENTDAMALLI